MKPKKRRHHGRQAAASVLSTVIPLMLCSCNGDDSGGTSSSTPLTVQKVASCTTQDNPESALQGQVPAALRASGFNGFNCNLQLTGQLQGEGGDWSSASFKDGAGHTCAYYATAYPFDQNGNSRDRVNPGVPVIDITNPTKPVRTMSLTTKAMLDPWESLRVNPRRQVLGTDDGQNGNGSAEGHPSRHRRRRGHHTNRNPDRT